MKITENNFTVTTIYFDGQFWCALVEQCRDGKSYAGRFVFGAEPSNPEIIHWMMHDFADIPLLPVEGRTKIRFKKLARTERNGGGIPKSLEAFSRAQKEYAEERKKQTRKQKKQEEKEKYLLIQNKKKERR